MAPCIYKWIQASDYFKSYFTPNSQAQLAPEEKRKAVARQRLLKQRRHRDLNPVPETRSANHQRLLLFF